MKITPFDSPSIFGQAYLGVALHPGQIRWLETRAKVKVACCGRRWGKSFAEAVDLLWFAFAYPETSQFLLAPTADQSRTIFRYAEQMLLSAPLLAPFIDSIVHSPFPMIELKTGAVIHARSAGDTGQNVRSHGADRLLLDEAAYIPEAAIGALSPLLATSLFAETVYISTAFGKNFFWELFTRGQAGEPGYASFQFPSVSSPHVSRDYLEQQRREMTDLAFRVEYLAEFAESQNAVFPWTLIQSCLVDEAEGEPIPNHRYTVGYDPAEFVDRAGVVVLDITEQPWQAIRCFDISGGGYIAQETAMVDLSEAYGQPPVLIDTTSHSQMLEHLRKEGVNADGYVFTNATKHELINGLVIAMEQGDVKIPRSHRDLIDELKYYRYETTPAGNIKLGADGKHHDDLLTALALAVHVAKVPDAGMLMAAPPVPDEPTLSTFKGRLARSKRR